jgi:hypothetical protein
LERQTALGSSPGCAPLATTTGSTGVATPPVASGPVPPCGASLESSRKAGLAMASSHFGTIMNIIIYIYYIYI